MYLRYKNDDALLDSYPTFQGLVIKTISIRLIFVWLVQTKLSIR